MQYIMLVAIKSNHLPRTADRKPLGGGLIRPPYLYKLYELTDGITLLGQMAAVESALSD